MLRLLFLDRPSFRVVHSANTGATNNLGDYVLAPLAIFYDDRA